MSSRFCLDSYIVKRVFLCFSHQTAPHLLQWQYELSDALLAAKLGQQFVRVHALAVASLHQLGHDPLHLLLLGHSPEQLVVEDLTNGGRRKRGDWGARQDVKTDCMSKNTHPEYTSKTFSESDFNQSFKLNTC